MNRKRSKRGWGILILSVAIFTTAFALGCCQARRAGMDQAAREIKAWYPEGAQMVETIYDKNQNPRLNIVTEPASQVVYDKNWNRVGAIVNGKVYDKNWNRVGSIRKLR
jgi:hypothetical protein